MRSPISFRFGGLLLGFSVNSAAPIRIQASEQLTVELYANLLLVDNGLRLGPIEKLQGR